MATPSKQVLGALAASRVRGLRSPGVSAVFEARLSHALEKVDGFVKAAEFAIADAAVVVMKDGASESLQGDQSDRLYGISDLEEIEGLLAIDFKSRSKTGNISYTSNQAIHDTLFIMQSVWAPHLTAVVPHFIALRRGGDIPNDRPVYTTHMEPFSKAISFCVMPTSLVPQAVQDYVKFFHEPERGWCNPHTGLLIAESKHKPSLSPVDIVLPQPTSHTRDLPDEILMWKSFAKWGKKCSVKRLLIKPSVGDFKLVYRHADSSLSYAIVEIKFNTLRMNKQDVISTINIDGGGYLGHQLTHDTAWDYLLNIDRRGLIPHALFVSRDSIPPEWFDHSSNTYKWSPGSNFVQKHRLPWGNEKAMKGFVQGVEAILDARIAAGRPVTADRLIPFKPPPQIEVKKLLGDETDQAALLEPLFQRSTVKQGVSHIRVHTLIELTVNRQCRERKFGWLYPTANHPTTTHIYAPVSWEGEPPDFFDLLHDTPCVSLNLAQVNSLGEYDAQVGYWSHFFRLFHGGHPTMYMLYPCGEDYVGQGMNYYMVPSECLQGDVVIKQGVDRAISGEGFAKKRRIRLVDDELIESYAVAERDIAAALEQACRKWSGAQHPTSSCTPKFANSRLFQDTVQSKLDIMQGYLDVELEKTWLTQKGKNGKTHLEDQDLDGDEDDGDDDDDSEYEE